ncbi:MAG: response regulator transcription factor [Alkalispirochaetaceae bacterium]
MIGTRIRVGVVDDHQVLRDGLKAVLEESQEGIAVLLEAPSAREALDRLEETELDVMIVDISMPGMDGIELSKIVHRDYPGVKIIVLTMYHDMDLIERALRAGVSGYVLKNNAAHMVADAVKAVHAGKTFFDRTIPAEALSQLRFRPKEHSKAATELTSRQIEVLRLICEGKTEREIAGELGISFHTAHAHKNNIMQKLGLHSKVELVRYAVQRNLLKM